MFNHDHEHIQKLIFKLKNTAQNAVILVEGKKDKIALRKLGVDSAIFLLNNKKSLVETSETIAASDIILMLDSDLKGRELTRKMKNHFQAQGVHVNTKLGRMLLRAAKTRTVESLDRVLKN